MWIRAVRGEITFNECMAARVPHCSRSEGRRSRRVVCGGRMTDALTLALREAADLLTQPTSWDLEDRTDASH